MQTGLCFALVIKTTTVDFAALHLQGPGNKTVRAERPFEFSPICDQVEDAREGRGELESQVRTPALLLVCRADLDSRLASLSLSFLVSAMRIMIILSLSSGLSRQIILPVPGPPI